ncbi:MAG: DUF1292 domain-containing protein [Clostridiaceae bacterium]|jgi:hypothetical protein|nr:DUF1292 domain-containing protein [Clostridiaceae bacterium]
MFIQDSDHEINDRNKVEDDCGCDECCCGCDCDGDMSEASIITMTDMETGEDYSFHLVDDFALEDEHYCVLVSADDDQDPSMVITRIVTMEDGSEGMMSLDDDEYERVLAAYDRLCEEEEIDDEEDDEEAE